jgi:hypothetical protein
MVPEVLWPRGFVGVLARLGLRWNAVVLASDVLQVIACRCQHLT